jgi:hypothetical protein
LKDLNVCALRLLKFVDESVNEAIADQTSRRALLIEADCAVRVLKRMLLREAPKLHAKLAIMDVFRPSFEHIASGQPADLSEQLKRALQIVLEARQCFR